MLRDVTGSTEFLAEAAALASRLDEQGRSVFQIRYDGQAFGSWVLIAGTAKRRVMVTWECRDGRFVAEVADFSDSQTPPVWNLLTEQTHTDRSPCALLHAAEQIVLAQSSAPAV